MVPFPFTNLERTTRRPAFVLASLGDAAVRRNALPARCWVRRGCPTSIPSLIAASAHMSRPPSRSPTPTNPSRGRRAEVGGGAGEPRRPVWLPSVSLHGGLSPLAGRRLGTLSAGWPQRVRLATCRVPHPRLWILDDPAQHLDHAGPLLREPVVAGRDAGWCPLAIMVAVRVPVALPNRPGGPGCVAPGRRPTYPGP